MKKLLFTLFAAVLGFAATAAAQTPAPAPAPTERFYGRADYLYWWMKDSPNHVPLVTRGFVGSPGTETLIGGNDVDFGGGHGVRLTTGFWLTPDRTWGLEASGFYLPTQTERISISSPDRNGVNLRVPFFNPNNGQESSSPLSASSPQDGFFGGSATESNTSRLWGVEGNVVYGLANPRPFRLELLGGFRYLSLREGLNFSTNTPDTPPGPVTVFQTSDQFDTHNEFYGGQIGLRGRYEAGRFIADATLKVGLGTMRQSADIAGSLTTNFFAPPTVQTFAGGLFAQRTNIGSYERHVFAVIPEIGVNVGFKLTNWASIVVGYNFLYANDVARPGDQIDRTINPTQSQAISLNNPANLSGTARPSFKFESTDFYAHGLNFGFAFNF